MFKINRNAMIYVDGEPQATAAVIMQTQRLIENALKWKISIEPNRVGNYHIVDYDDDPLLIDRSATNITISDGFAFWKIGDRNGRYRTIAVKQEEMEAYVR